MPSHGFPGPRLACQGQTRLSLILLRKRTDAEYSSEGLQHSLLESTVTRSSFRASGVSLTGLSPASVDNTRLATAQVAGMTPATYARRTRSVRLAAPVRRSILAMCWATVYLLMCSWSAIWIFVKPCAVNRKTLHSRTVRAWKHSET